MSARALPTALAAPREFPFTREDFARVRALIQREAGIAIGPNKADMVYSRLVRRVRSRGLPSFAAYLDLVESSDADDERDAFRSALTTHLTGFFREPHHFKALRELFARRPADAHLWLWSGACSSGEEAYSIAITACEHYATLHPPVSILASDVDPHMVRLAREGIYPLDAVSALSRERLRRFFRRGVGSREGYCRAVDALRALISFRTLNLLDGAWQLPARMDAAFIRNVMIYFDKPAQQAVLERLHGWLAPDGLLFAGHSESLLHLGGLFEARGRTIYAPRRR